MALGSGGFKWVFWCLVIYGGTTLLIMGWMLPKTGKSMVGDGSVQAVGWHKTWWDYISDGVKEKWELRAWVGEGTQNRGEESEKSKAENKEKKIQRSYKISNPFACLRLFFWRDTALVLWMNPSFYSIWYCIQTSIPSIYQDLYDFKEFETGLSFLTGGVGVILGGFATGKIMDRNYKITANEKLEHTVDTVSGDDMNYFPKRKSKIKRFLVSLNSLYLLFNWLMDWAIPKHAHPELTLDSPVSHGFPMHSLQSELSDALLVDIFLRKNPSSAAALGNMTRLAFVSHSSRWFCTRLSTSWAKANPSHY